MSATALGPGKRFRVGRKLGRRVPSPIALLADVWLIDTPSPRVRCLRMAGVGAAEQIYQAFGGQVRKRREVLGLTQLQLSTRIGLTRGSVANIKAGRQSALLHQFLSNLHDESGVQ
jgi:DNA-binding XRE family transcriptional regulator